MANKLLLRILELSEKLPDQAKKEKQQSVHVRLKQKDLELSGTLWRDASGHQQMRRPLANISFNASQGHVAKIGIHRVRAPPANACQSSHRARVHPGYSKYHGCCC